VQEQKGGNTSGTQSRGGQSAQGTEKQGAQKQNERLGEGRNEEQQKGMTQENRGTQQKGAQEEKGATQQKGAQEERGLQQKGTQQKGAQEERGLQQKGTQQKGAQQERGTQQPKGAQEGAQQPSGTQQRGVTEQQTGKPGTSTTERAGQSGTSRGTSVQLSEDKRTQIKTIIGKGHAPRVSGNENFDVTVGAKIPRSVHVEVLPEEIVRIVPEYRGFHYVLVRDEILIIDPQTLEIVAVIPA
jgi:hypothetical protein